MRIIPHLPAGGRECIGDRGGHLRIESIPLPVRVSDSLRYEQEPMDQVGAAAAFPLGDPAVLKDETCLIGSRVPHLGQTGGSCRRDRTR